MARDGGFVVTAAVSSEPGGPGFPVSIRLIDLETGAAVPGRDTEWDSQQPTAAWHPVEPLQPRHACRVEASLTDGAGAPIEGSEVITSSFETRDSLLEPLQIRGDIQVTYEGYDAEVQSYENTTCGPRDCVPTGTRRALRATLELPAATGGQAPQGYYRTRLHFTDNAPLGDVPAGGAAQFPRRVTPGCLGETKPVATRRCRR